ncbi:MAG: type II secretion system F family protein [Candidatus Omnitrophica bacterium]|nr:type II secretion system F family protein [Candidatus Omnitrophota bacterium]
MPRYTYLAKSSPAKTIRGFIEAESEQDAINKLTSTGYFPISVSLEDLSLESSGIFRLRKISKKDILLFTQQLSNLLDSGVNLSNGLGMISRQASNRYLRLVLSDVIAKIKDGSPLSESLAVCPGLFSNLYRSMVRTGEASGSLNQTLKSLVGFLEKEAQFKNYLKTTLTYPVFLLLVSIFTVVVILLFIIPRIISMFNDLGQVLPLPTIILINISSFLRDYGWVILAASLVGIFTLRRLYQNPQGRFSFDRLKLKLVIFGKISLKTELSRLMRTLSLLLSSGMPITLSLETSLSILDNEVLKNEVRKFKESISRGISLSAAVKASEFFPEFVVDILQVGEETGALDRSLMRIAVDYEKEVGDSLKTLTQMFEPVVILVMGLIVSFIVISMLLPIFQINLIVR